MIPTAISGYAPGTIAVLGLAAMKRMERVFDGSTGIAYMHPFDTPPTPFVHNRLGAIFIPADAKTSPDLVAHVGANSPAAQAGVRDGDLLLKIDHLDVTPWQTQPGILPLYRFWEQAPGTKLRLTIKRGVEIFEIDAVLQNILGPNSK